MTTPMAPAIGMEAREGRGSVRSTRARPEGIVMLISTTILMLSGSLWRVGRRLLQAGAAGRVRLLNITTLS